MRLLSKVARTDILSNAWMEGFVLNLVTITVRISFDTPGGIINDLARHFPDVGELRWT